MDGSSNIDNEEDASLPNWSYLHQDNIHSTSSWISPHRQIPFNSLETAIYFNTLIDMNRNNEWCAWKELRDGKLKESLIGVSNPSLYDAKQSDIDAGVFLVEPSSYPGLFTDSENEFEEKSLDSSSDFASDGEKTNSSLLKSPPESAHSPLRRSNRKGAQLANLSMHVRFKNTDHAELYNRCYLAHNHGQLDPTRSHYLLGKALLVETHENAYSYAIVVGIHRQECGSNKDDPKQDQFTIVLVDMVNPMAQYLTLSERQLDADDDQYFNKKFIKFVPFDDAYQASVRGGYLFHQISGPHPEPSRYLVGSIDSDKYNDLGFALDYVPRLLNPEPGEKFEVLSCTFLHFSTSLLMLVLFESVLLQNNPELDKKRKKGMLYAHINHVLLTYSRLGSLY